jgi:hypothetical protein
MVPWRKNPPRGQRKIRTFIPKSDPKLDPKSDPKFLFLFNNFFLIELFLQPIFS